MGYDKTPYEHPKWGKSVFRGWGDGFTYGYDTSASTLRNCFGIAALAFLGGSTLCYASNPELWNKVSEVLPKLLGLY
jgi:hypothetical protein